MDKDSGTSNSTCDLDPIAISNGPINWIIIILGLLATMVNCVVTKASQKLNYVVERMKKIGRQATLRPLARSHFITYFFIIHQSIAHALVCFTPLISILADMYAKQSTGIPFLVKEIALLIGLYQLIYIITERYWSLVFPLRPPPLTFSKRVIYSVWVLGVLLNVHDIIILTDNYFKKTQCSNVRALSINRFSNRYFAAVSIFPVIVVFIGCSLILYYLRAAKKASKMFTCKSVKALKGAMTLTKNELILLLVYTVSFIIFTVSTTRLSNTPRNILTFRFSYMLLSCYSMLYPVVVLYNYQPIRRKANVMLSLYKRSYGMQVRYINNSFMPITLVRYCNYNTATDLAVGNKQARSEKTKEGRTEGSNGLK